MRPTHIYVYVCINQIGGYILKEITLDSVEIEGRDGQTKNYEIFLQT